MLSGYDIFAGIYLVAILLVILDHSGSEAFIYFGSANLLDNVSVFDFGLCLQQSHLTMGKSTPLPLPPTLLSRDNH